MRLTKLLVLLPMLLPLQRLSANSLFVALGGANYACVNSTNACSNDPSFTWTAGDYFGENVLGSPVNPVAEIDLSLLVENALIVDETVNVVINGNTVGGFTVAACGACANNVAITNVFTFAPIAGPDFLVQFVLQNTVPGGEGSLGVYHDDVNNSGFTLVDGSSVPEPATVGMIGLAIPALFLLRRRLGAFGTTRD